jgi:aryl-alcohol dehydrogenase-like predicted oxidoreductase
MSAIVSRLGFGVTGPHATALVSAHRTAALIAQALAGGVTLFDSAPFYGGGEGERRLGRAIEAAAARERVVLSTKLGTRRANGRVHKDFSPAGIGAQLSEALGNLRTARADLVFLHGPEPHDLKEGALATLEREHAKGRIGAIGVAGRGPELAAALEYDCVGWLMCPALVPALAPVLDRAAERGVGVIAIETMRARAVAPRMSLRPADLWYSARAILRPAGTTACAGGIGAALALPAVQCALVTTTRDAHLTANLAAAGLA